jgi:hypothetical protein
MLRGERCCSCVDVPLVLNCFLQNQFCPCTPLRITLLARAITAPSHARAGARRCLRRCRVRCQRKVACSGVKGAEARRCKAAAHTRGGTVEGDVGWWMTA